MLTRWNEVSVRTSPTTPPDSTSTIHTDCFRTPSPNPNRHRNDHDWDLVPALRVEWGSSCQVPHWCAYWVDKDIRTVVHQGALMVAAQHNTINAAGINNVSHNDSTTMDTATTTTSTASTTTATSTSQRMRRTSEVDEDDCILRTTEILFF